MWDSDRSCAKEAFRRFRKQIYCCAGDEDPDHLNPYTWWVIDATRDGLYTLDSMMNIIEDA